MSGGRADFRAVVSKTPPYVTLSNASAKLIFRTVCRSALFSTAELDELVR
jgi:hypothetical protein